MSKMQQGIFSFFPPQALALQTAIGYKAPNPNTN
jgi:hypothetical protein